MRSAASSALGTPTTRHMSSSMSPSKSAAGRSGGGGSTLFGQDDASSFDATTVDTGEDEEEQGLDLLAEYGFAPVGSTRNCKGVHADMARVALDRGFGWTTRNAKGERPVDIAALQAGSDGWGKAAALRGAAGDGAAPLGKTALSPGPTPAARTALRARRVHRGFGLDAGPTAGVGLGGALIGRRVRGGGANLGGKLKWFGPDPPPPVFTWTLSGDSGGL